MHEVDRFALDLFALLPSTLVPSMVHSRHACRSAPYRGRRWQPANCGQRQGRGLLCSPSSLHVSSTTAMRHRAVPLVPLPIGAVLPFIVSLCPSPLFPFRVLFGLFCSSSCVPRLTLLRLPVDAAVVVPTRGAAHADTADRHTESDDQSTAQRPTPSTEGDIDTTAAPRCTQPRGEGRACTASGREETPPRRIACADACGLPSARRAHSRPPRRLTLGSG
jgi:hypothetical protein